MRNGHTITLAVWDSICRVMDWATGMSVDIPWKMMTFYCCSTPITREILFVLPVLRDQTLFEVMIDTALPQGQPVSGSDHPPEEPYPVQGRSLVVLRHRRVSRETM